MPPIIIAINYMIEPPPVTRLLINLYVGGAQILYIMAAADGSTHRLGTGAAPNTNNDLFIGTAEAAVFQRIASLSNSVKNWLGEFADPRPSGSACRLMIGLQLSSGEELRSSWQYGTNSQEPPPEICQFVVGAIEATGAWFEEQKSLVASRP